MVEAAEVVSERFFAFKIDIEGGEIGIFRLKILGGRVVCVGKKQPRCEFFPQGDEALKGLADFQGAHPADEVGGNFVADIDSGERRVLADGFE